MCYSITSQNLHFVIACIFLALSVLFQLSKGAWPWLCKPDVAYEGEPITFTCIDTSKWVLWQRSDDIFTKHDCKKSTNIECSSEKLESIQLYIHTLTIKSVHMEDDNSLWRCTGQDQHRCKKEKSCNQRLSNKIQLMVIARSSIPYPTSEDMFLEPNSTQYTVYEYDNITDIECSSDCGDNCTYTWSDPEGQSMGMGSILQLGELTRDTAGVYVCTATNTSTQHYDFVTLAINVVYGPDKVTTNVTSSPRIVTAGETVSKVMCSAACWPRCVRNWIRTDGRSVDQAEGVLDIGTASVNSSGTYVCEVWNIDTRFNRSMTTKFELVVTNPCHNHTIVDFYYKTQPQQQFCWYTNGDDACVLYKHFNIEVKLNSSDDWETVVTIQDSLQPTPMTELRNASLNKVLPAGTYTARIRIGGLNETLATNTFTVYAYAEANYTHVSMVHTVHTDVLYIVVGCGCLLLVSAFVFVYLYVRLARRYQDTLDTVRRPLPLARTPSARIPDEDPKPCEGQTKLYKEHLRNERYRDRKRHRYTEKERHRYAAATEKQTGYNNASFYAE